MTRPTLVVVSPLPPAWTGIADYTARLLPHLARHWEIVVVVADDDPPPLPALEQVTVIHARSWEWYRHLGRLDRLLLCLGNSDFHLHVPEMCARHGGVVLAHDVRMTALQCLRAAASPDRHLLSALVADRHGPQLAGEIRAMEEEAPIREWESFNRVRGRLESANALLLGAAVRGADAVVVHSQLAARLATLDLPVSGPAVAVVPFGHPEPDPDPDTRAGAVIASFGGVEPEKQPVILINALATVRRRIPDAVLRFVGSRPNTLLQPVLEQTAARLGVADAIEYCGRLDAEAYVGELRGATVAVQLRGVVNGEASAAVADCLAAGIPTVVTDIGAQAELPETVAVRVSPRITGARLGQELARLLEDPERRSRLGRSAREYAAGSSFAVAAEALTQVLEAAPPPRR